MPTLPKFGRDSVNINRKNISNNTNSNKNRIQNVSSDDTFLNSSKSDINALELQMAKSKLATQFAMLKTSYTKPQKRIFRSPSLI